MGAHESLHWGRDTDGETDREDATATSRGGLLDLLRVAAMVLDEQGRIVLWSPEAEHLFGYPASQMLGRNAARMLVAPENRLQVVKLFDQVMAGAWWSGVFPVLHADGKTRDVEFRKCGCTTRKATCWPSVWAPTSTPSAGWGEPWPCRSASWISHRSASPSSTPI
jgi:PAS domain S-box-containing protein